MKLISNPPFLADDPMCKLYVRYLPGGGVKVRDWSPSKHTLTVGGSATNSTAQSKFGDGSIQTTNGSISAAASPDWNFTLGWTIGGWFRPTVAAVNQTIFSIDSAVTNQLILVNRAVGTLQPNFYYKNSAAQMITTALTLNAWNYVEIDCTASGTIYGSVNGVINTLLTGQAANDLSSYPFYISTYDGTNQPYSGGFDEFFILVGRCLHTASFTPPRRRMIA